MTSSYPSLRLKPHRERSWSYGHPWVFSGAIERSQKPIEPGSLVRVFDHDGQFQGVGSYNGRQSLALRLFTRRDVKIDFGFLRARFAALLKERRAWLGADTDAFRLCFGESDGLPGLVVDVYGLCAVLQVSTKGMERLLPFACEALQAVGFTDLFVSSETHSAKLEGVGAFPQPPRAFADCLENGFRIRVPLGQGQKTGWFCDQRENRRLVGDWVRRMGIASVLNLFSYTGGFSLYAAAGGASHILDVDRDREALSLSGPLLEANGFSAPQTICADVWAYLKQARQEFDLVIVDPPAFVKEQSKKPAALIGYRDLFAASLAPLKAGGSWAVFSCSHFVGLEDLQLCVRQAMHKTGRWFQTIRPLFQGSDHPVPAFFPESAYLKGFLLQEVGAF